MSVLVTFMQSPNTYGRAITKAEPKSLVTDEA